MRLDLECQIQPKRPFLKADDAANIKSILCFSYARGLRDEGARGAAYESNSVHGNGWEEVWVRDLWLGLELFSFYSCQAVQSGSTCKSYMGRPGQYLYKLAI